MRATRVPGAFLRDGRMVQPIVRCRLLIAVAYHLPYQSPQLSGGAEWMRSDRYDLEANPDAPQESD